MPAKISRSAPRPPFRLREVSIAVRTLRLSYRKAGKAPIFTPVRQSSGESRLICEAVGLWAANCQKAEARRGLGRRGRL